MRIKDNITKKTTYKFKGLLVSHIKPRRSFPFFKNQAPPLAFWSKIPATMETEVGKDASLDGCIWKGMEEEKGL